MTFGIAPNKKRKNIIIGLDANKRVGNADFLHFQAKQRTKIFKRDDAH